MSESLLSLLDKGKLRDYTKLFLINYGIRARKKLGQNFIINKKIIDITAIIANIFLLNILLIFSNIFSNNLYPNNLIKNLFIFFIT